jgi:hypothetical protein
MGYGMLVLLTLAKGNIVWSSWNSPIRELQHRPTGFWNKPSYLKPGIVYFCNIISKFGELVKTEYLTIWHQRTDDLSCLSCTDYCQTHCVINSIHLVTNQHKWKMVYVRSSQRISEWDKSVHEQMGHTSLSSLHHCSYLHTHFFVRSLWVLNRRKGTKGGWKEEERKRETKRRKERGREQGEGLGDILLVQWGVDLKKLMRGNVPLENSFKQCSWY